MVKGRPNSSIPNDSKPKNSLIKHAALATSLEKSLPSHELNRKNITIPKNALPSVFKSQSENEISPEPLLLAESQGGVDIQM